MEVVVILIDNVDKPRDDYAHGYGPEGGAHDIFGFDPHLPDEVPDPQHQSYNSQSNHYPIPMYGDGTDAEGNRVNSDLDLAPLKLEATGKKRRPEISRCSGHQTYESIIGYTYSL